MNNKKKASNVNNNVKVPSPDDEHYFLKFPRTRHLFDAGGGVGRDDLVMDPHEMKEFLKNEIVIEEKVDGANLGISMTEDYKLQFQNRSHWVTSATATQWKTLDLWVQSHPGLFNFLNQDLILFGEWMYAKHSIHYTDLPDTFLAFDIWNKKLEKFLSVKERDQLLEGSGIHTVRNLGRGTFTQDQIAALLNTNSEFYNGPIEGVYLRIDDNENGVLKERAKVVRHDFLQTNEEGTVEHWTKTTLVKNIIKYEGNQLLVLLLKPTYVHAYTRQLIQAGRPLQGKWFLKKESIQLDFNEIQQILPFVPEWKPSEKQPQYLPDEEEQTFSKLSESINQISRTVYANITQLYQERPQVITDYCLSIANLTKAPWLTQMLLEPLVQVCQTKDTKIPWSYFGLLCSLLDKCLAECYLAISAADVKNQSARLGTVRMYRLLLTPQLRVAVPPSLVPSIPHSKLTSFDANDSLFCISFWNLFWHGYLGGEVEPHLITFAIALICSLLAEVSEKAPLSISGIPQEVHSSISTPLDGMLLWFSSDLKEDTLQHNIKLIEHAVESMSVLQNGRKAALLEGVSQYQKGNYLACLVCLVPQIEFLLRMLFIDLNNMPPSLATSDGPRFPMASHLDASTVLVKEEVGLCIAVVLAILKRMFPEMMVPKELEEVTQGVSQDYIPRYHPRRMLDRKIKELSLTLETAELLLQKIHPKHFYRAGQFDQLLSESLPQATDHTHSSQLTESQIATLQQVCSRTQLLLEKLFKELEKQIEKLKADRFIISDPPSEDVSAAQAKQLDLFSKTATSLRSFHLFGKFIVWISQNAEYIQHGSWWKQLNSLPNVLDQTLTKLSKYQWEPAIKGMLTYSQIFSEIAMKIQS